MSDLPLGGDHDQTGLLGLIQSHHGQRAGSRFVRPCSQLGGERDPLDVQDDLPDLVTKRELAGKGDRGCYIDLGKIVYFANLDSRIFHDGIATVHDHHVTGAVDVPAATSTDIDSVGAVGESPAWEIQAKGRPEMVAVTVATVTTGRMIRATCGGWYEVFLARFEVAVYIGGDFQCFFLGPSIPFASKFRDAADRLGIQDGSACPPNAFQAFHQARINDRDPRIGPPVIPYGIGHRPLRCREGNPGFLLGRDRFDGKFDGLIRPGR